MKAAYIQMNPELLDVKANIGKAEKLLSKASADIIVLPELFNTGYTFSIREEILAVSENIPHGPTSEFLIETAKAKNAFISAGISELEDDKLYNSALLAGPDGYIGKYRKVHLFFREKCFYEKGDLGYPVFETGNFKAGMLVCFDWFFPEAMRALALAGAQMILHPTNLVMPYYQAASITRALENRVFIIIANRYGTETNQEFTNTFTGSSQIVSHKGEILVSSPEDGDHIGVAELDPSLADDKNLNPMNNLWEDM